MMTRPLILAAPLLLVAACVEPAPTAVQPTEPDRCGSAGLQGLVGQPRSVLRTMLFPAGTRVIGAGDAVTMDYSPERLNIEIGPDSRIAKIACY